MSVRKRLFPLVTVMSSIVCAPVAATPPEQAEAATRPAIVLVAFGTSNPEARKVFDHIDATARKRYPQHSIRWAYTSQFIIAKLRRQGVQVASLPEAIADLKRDGYRSAVFQPLHVTPGQEYHEIQQVDTSGLQITVGHALLATDDDIKAVIGALHKDIQANVPNVVICHGNRRHPEFNRQLLAFAQQIERQHPNVVACSIEGQPGTEKLAKAKREAASKGKVHFIPLMVVAGVHVAEDVLSDDADSWKTIIGAKESTCGKPLGYRDKVLAVYFEHLNAALANLDQQLQPKPN